MDNKPLLNKLSWGNLAKGLCIKCDKVLVVGSKVTCECGFTISLAKYIELSKGTESSFYKEKVKVFKSINKYHKSKKVSYAKAYEAQRQETARGVRRRDLA